MPELSTFYFGRLNLIATYSDKREFLIRSLRSNTSVEQRRIIWDFFDIQEISSETGTYLYGYLAKYRPVTDEEIANPTDQTIVETAIRNLIVAKSRFFLHIEDGLVIFHPQSGQIEIGQFCNMFATLIERANNDFFVNAEVQIVQDQYKLLEMLPQFSKLTRLTISLHPSNPNLSPTWDTIDRDLKDKGADKLTETYESGKRFESLNVANDSEIKAKIVMAEDGYGEAAITGIVNGEVKTITTKDNPVSAQAPNDDVPAPDVLSMLTGKIKQIFSRFNK